MVYKHSAFFFFFWLVLRNLAVCANVLSLFKCFTVRQWLLHLFLFFFRAQIEVCITKMTMNVTNVWNDIQNGSFTDWKLCIDKNWILTAHSDNHRHDAVTLNTDGKYFLKKQKHFLTFFALHVILEREIVETVWSLDWR